MPHLWRDEEILWCDRPLTTGPVAAASARKGFYKTLTALGGLAFLFVYSAVSLLGERDLGALSLPALGAGVLTVGAILAARTAWDWLRARRAALDMAYGVTNRRIIVLQRGEVDWIGPRGLDSVEVRGQNVIITRQRSAIEQLWHPDAVPLDISTDYLNEDDTSGEGIEVGEAFVDKANVVAYREVTLASVADPRRVADLIQTLKQSAAS
jgi:hypothetical protein